MATSGKAHGKSAAVIVGGYDLSGDYNSVEADLNTATADTTGFGSNAETYIAGLNADKVTAKGFYDDGASGLHTALKSMRQTSQVGIFCPTGDTQGYAALIGQAQIPSAYKVTSDTKNAVLAQTDFMCSGGVEIGVSLLPRTALTGTGSAQNQASLDQGASSANGASAAFAITAIDASTAVSAFKVQHSADNVTFVDLLTSGLGGAAVGADRQSVSGSVNRYVRATATVTTGNHATLAVAFARK